VVPTSPVSDEQPLTGDVHLAQRRLQPSRPLAIQVAELRIAEPVGRRRAVFLPQQRQRYVRPPQIAMHRGPVRDRALVGRDIRQQRKQQRFETGIVQRFRQRPGQTRAAVAAEVVADRRLTQPQAICDNALWELLLPSQPQKLAYLVAMQRPDKLRVLIPGDGPASEFYYDGKSMMAYAPVENLVAIASAPPTIDGALKAAFDAADIYYPFTDLLVADPYAAMTDGAILAFYIGPSGMVGGTKTEMLAWANPDVFLQIWIGTDDKLPRRVRAVYSADPLSLRHELDLSNWQIDAEIPAETFTSEKAQSAQQMKFDRPAHAAAPPGLKPLGTAKATPAQPAAK
jgi:hypothetical protein